MCRMSRVTFFFFFGQSGEAYWWRVCYQQGLPCLVFLGMRQVTIDMPTEWGGECSLKILCPLLLMFGGRLVGCSISNTDGILTGLTRYRLPLYTFSEYPEPWT